MYILVVQSLQFVCIKYIYSVVCLMSWQHVDV